MTPATEPAFNLLDEPWIPLRTPAGDVVEASLADALLKARDYAAIAETSPPNLIALYRLLLAALHRALTTKHGQWKDADRARWFREGLTEMPIRAYLEQWRERFWLFHPTHPFMQVAELAHADKTRDKLKPWSQLALEMSGGDTPLVFDRSLDTKPEPASYTQVLRSLLGYLQFTPGGLVKTFKTSDFAGPLASTTAVMPVGRSLCETLLLSLHTWTRESASDLPAWEAEPLTINDVLQSPTLPAGHNDRYTRLTRSILILPDEQAGLVRFIRFSEGKGLADDNLDPMVSCRVIDGVARRISFTDGRSIWRDLPSLVPDTTRTYDIQAASIGWASELYERLGDSSVKLKVVAAGWKNAPNKAAKIVRWRLDLVELPQRLLLDVDTAQTLREQIRSADNIYFSLCGLCADLIACTMPDPTHKDTKARARDIMASGPAAAIFFSGAERALPKLMQQIAAGDIESADREWKTALQKAARNAWEAVRRSLGDSPAALKADAKFYPRFIGLLKSLIPSTDEPVTEEVNP